MNYSYIAGFIDGEGTVSIIKNKIRLTIPNTNKEVLVVMKDYIGFGSIYENKKRGSNKICWTYSTTNIKDTLSLLESIYNLLIIKKDISLKAIKIAKKYIEDNNKREKLIKESLCLVEKGYSYRQVQKITGINRGTIYRRLKIVHRSNG